VTSALCAGAFFYTETPQLSFYFNFPLWSSCQDDGVRRH